jgi:hypothetical protein
MDFESIYKLNEADQQQNNQETQNTQQVETPKKQDPKQKLSKHLQNLQKIANNLGDEKDIKTEIQAMLNWLKKNVKEVNGKYTFKPLINFLQNPNSNGKIDTSKVDQNTVQKIKQTLANQNIQYQDEVISTILAAQQQLMGK